jgi:Ser/Thr protein kinase RdoA (MazF antagonist)
MALHKLLLDPGQIKNAFKAYDIDEIQLLNYQNGYRNHSFPAILKNGQKINLIIYKSEPSILTRIKTANDVSNYLASRGMPSRTTLDPRILNIQIGSISRYASLYNYLPGDTIPWEAYTRTHLKLLGRNMAKMHNLLKDFSIESPNSIAEEYTLLTIRMKSYFSKKGVNQAMIAKLNLKFEAKKCDNYGEIFLVCGKIPHQQVLHMDFVRGNILFQQDKELHLSGILDFEKAGNGLVIIDIARTLSFLFIDCKFKTIDEVHRHFLVNGYIRSGNTSFNDLHLNISYRKVSLLNELINFFLLHDFYKFLLHNPYEHLHENEHFIRTRDYLAQQKVLEYTK